MRIITETRNLRATPFIPGDDQINTGRAWDDWIEEIEREFRYFKITDPIDKKDALIFYGGKEIARLEKSLPNPTDAMNDYEKLRKKLNDYFTPKKNKQYARYLFLKMKPTHGETTVAYKCCSSERERQRVRIRNKLRQPNPGTPHPNDVQSYANSESRQQEMEFDTISHRSCPNGGHFTSSKRHENSRRCKEVE